MRYCCTYCIFANTKKVKIQANSSNHYALQQVTPTSMQQHRVLSRIRASTRSTPLPGAPLRIDRARDQRTAALKSKSFSTGMINISTNRLGQYVEVDVVELQQIIAAKPPCGRHIPPPSLYLSSFLYLSLLSSLMSIDAKNRGFALSCAAFYKSMRFFCFNSTCPPRPDAHTITNTRA